MFTQTFHRISCLLLAAAGSAMAVPLPTSTVLSLSNSNLTLGIPVQLVVTVTPPANGTLVFYDGSEVFATAQFVNGNAELTHSFGIGPHALTAAFLGTTSYLGSRSATQVFTTDGVLTTSTTIFYLNNDPAGIGGEVFNNGPLAPRGTLTFQANSNFSGTAPLTVNAPIPSLRPQSKFKVGTFPVSVAVGDFNNDGVPDIVTANGGGNLSVLIGKMGPVNEITYGFEAQAVYGTDPNPSAVAVGDFNGDGVQDIVVASDRVNVLLGNGNGAFAPQVSSDLGAETGSIAVGDFNRDGILDVAVVNFTTSQVTVGLGKGDGTFPNPQTYGVGNFPQFVAAADLNNDGILDLVVANFGANTISVLLGKANGTFKPQAVYPVGTHPGAVVVADFNGDGLADVAVSNYLDGTIGVLLNQGLGVLAPQVTYPAHGSPESMAIGDLNGDGFPDLVTSNDQNDVSIFLGSRTGTFTFEQNGSVGTSPYGITVADVNRDGIQDIVAANRGNGDGPNTVSVLIGALTQSAYGVLASFPNEGPNEQVTINYSGDMFHSTSTVTAPYPQLQ